MANTVTETADVLEVKTEMKEYARPPAGEPIAGVIAGWKNLGKCQVNFKGQTRTINKIMVKILLDALDEDGQPICAVASFNASTNQESSLVRFLRDLTGVDYSNKAVNVLTTVGQCASFLFEDSVSKTNGRTYSNLKSTFRPKNQKKVAIPEGYVAFRDKVDKVATGAVEVADTETKPKPTKI